MDDLELYDDAVCVPIQEASLDLSELDEDTVLREGIIGWGVGQVTSSFRDNVNELMSWFRSAGNKVKKTSELCDDLIEWLEDEKRDNPGLSMKMGSLGTFFKSSEWFRWRYFYLLDDSTFARLMSDGKKFRDGHFGLSAVITYYNTAVVGSIFNMDSVENRRKAGQLLDNVKDIDGYIKIVKLYKSRAEQYGKLLIDKRVHAGFPFQTMHLGLLDLRYSIRQAVRLAR